MDKGKGCFLAGNENAINIRRRLHASSFTEKYDNTYGMDWIDMTSNDNKINFFALGLLTSLCYIYGKDTVNASEE